MSPFCWATDTPVFGLLVTSPLGFKARVGSALFALGEGIRVAHYLRFTSGATPADLLAANMAAEPISSAEFPTCVYQGSYQNI